MSGIEYVCVVLMLTIHSISLSIIMMDTSAVRREMRELRASMHDQGSITR